MSSKPTPLTRLPRGRVLIAPSLLAADFSRTGEEVRRVEQAGADILHVDIMDGHFVPNLSMGPPVVRALRPTTALPFDVHLMLTHPGRYVEAFVEAGADHITAHVEMEEDVREVLARIHAAGCSAGLSLKPGTPAEAIRPYLDSIDLVLVMTVEPGFGGQSFMADMVPKIETFRRWIDAGTHPVHLEVDGGINPETAAIAVRAGARILVAGTSIFRAAAADTAAVIARLRQAGREA